MSLFEGAHEPKRPRQSADARIAELIRHFDHLHREYVYGAPAVIDGKKDGALLKTMLRDRDVDTLGQLMDLFFKTPDKFVDDAGFSIGIFKLRLPSLVAKLARDNNRRAAKTFAYWFDDCRKHHFGECPNEAAHEERCVKEGRR